MKFRLHNVIAILVLILTVILSVGFVCASDLQENHSSSNDSSALDVEHDGALADSVTSSNSNSLANSTDNGINFNTNISANGVDVNDNISSNASVSDKSNRNFNNLKNISISGKVIRCDSGLAFSGVTIKVFDLKRKFTLQDSN